MPRLPRLDLPGQFYHVMVRGVERRSIFRDDLDRQDFLARLIRGLEKTRALCLTWALMTNHLHLLILSGASGLAALMHPLLTGYVGAFNRRYRRVGHLVQNRFKAILCEEDPYLLELIRYIPLNPVRAGWVTTPEQLAQYPWTGHRAILGTIQQGWQATDEVLGRFGSQVSAARQAYERHVIDAWDQGERKDLEGGGLLRSRGGLSGVLEARAEGTPEAFDARILGSGDFVERILREADQADEQRRAIAESGLTLEHVLSLAADTTGTPVEALRRHDRRRPVTEARALFIYAATEVLKLRAAVPAAILEMSSGSISEARQRGRRLAEKYRFLERLNNRRIPSS